MWKCQRCGATAETQGGVPHTRECVNIGGCTDMLIAIAAGADEREERRTRAMERQAEAIQHAATAMADFAMALNTFGPVLRMLAAEMEADLKKRAKP